MTASTLPSDYSGVDGHALSAVPERVLNAARTHVREAASDLGIDPSMASVLADTALLGLASLIDVTGRDADYAKQVVISSGHVVVRDTAHRRAQERLRAAEARVEAAEAELERLRARVEHDLVPRERYLADRVTYLAALAVSRGASIDEVTGDRIVADSPSLVENARALLREAAADGSWTTGDLAYRMDILLAKASQSTSARTDNDLL